MLRSLFNVSLTDVIRLRYVDDENDLVELSSEAEFNEAKILMINSERVVAHLLLERVNVSPAFNATGRNSKRVLPSINSVSACFEALNDDAADEEGKEFFSSDASSEMEEYFDATEESALLSTSTERCKQRDYDVCSNLGNVEQDSMAEEFVYNFDHELAPRCGQLVDLTEAQTSDNISRVLMKNTGTETNDLFFPTENFILQKETVLVQGSHQCDCYFHPNAQNVMKNMKIYIESIIESKKKEIIDEWINKHYSTEDTQTEYGEADIFDSQDDDDRTLCGDQDEEDDNKTIVLDVEDQTPYIPRQVIYLPMSFSPISTTLSIRMPAPESTFELSQEMAEERRDENEWIDVAEECY